MCRQFGIAESTWAQWLNSSGPAHIDYNQNRPHGDLTPGEFAQTWTTNRINQPQAV